MLQISGLLSKEVKQRGSNACPAYTWLPPAVLFAQVTQGFSQSTLTHPSITHMSSVARSSGCWESVGLSG